ncbi:MAG: methyltransferase domain-containing protein, partial [Pseudomonadota bacterium]
MIGTVILCMRIILTSRTITTSKRDISRMEEQYVVSPLPCCCCGGEMRVGRSGIALCAACGSQSSELPSGAGTGIEGLETLRRRNFESLLTRIETRRPLRGARLLEVGCAKGWFLEAARRRGAECFGIEPEEANAVIAREAGF